MFDLLEIKNTLSTYIENSGTEKKEIRVYDDLCDEWTGEPLVFLRIRQIENNKYIVHFESDGEGQWSELTELTLNNQHLTVALISDAIKRHNEAGSKRLRNLFVFLTCLGLGLVVAGIFASIVFTGGFSLLALAGFGAALGFTLGSGFITGLLSYISFHALDKWIDKTESGSKKAYDGFDYKPLAKLWWQRALTPFSWINSGLKWLARTLVLDNTISQFVFGNLIALIANKGNPHYKIEAKPVTQTLGSLIFAGGLQSPKVNHDGSIYLGPVLGAQHRVFHDFNPNESEFKFRSFRVNVKKGVVLDGVEASNGLAEDKDSLNLIYFNGNSSSYEHSNHVVIKDLQAYRDNEVPVRAIQFNYPGVLKSTGKVTYADDLIQAGIAQVERLHHQGVPYENIGLHGVSLGGSVVSHVASYYHERGIELAGTYASKTFSSTTNVAVSYLQKIPYVGHALGFVFRPLIVFGLWGSGWQMDTAAHFSSLPLDKRNYSLVRSEKRLRKDYAPKDDPVLSHYASLHESWRLRLHRFFHKHGLFGYDKSTYRMSHSQRKMSVFQEMDESDAHVFSPQLCGHSLENMPGIHLYHRNVAGEGGVHLEFPDKPGSEATKIISRSGPTSKQRIQMFFSERHPAISTRTKPEDSSLSLGI
jgi:hypothetical protein